MTQDGSIVIYFLRISEGPPDHRNLRVKIGKTRDLERRIAQHRAPKNGREPEEVETLAAVWGSGAHETALHRHFGHLLIEGQREVFVPGDELVAYIRWLRDQHFVWVPDDPYGLTLSDLPRLTFDVWRPNNERQKKTTAAPGLFEVSGLLSLPPRVITGDDYYTNPRIIEAARHAMGDIDLDPASHASANATVKAGRFFTKADNGLAQEWSGRVWMNPPFSAWPAWSEKALLEIASGRIDQICALAANRTVSANYFFPFMKTANASCNTKGRIPFAGIAGRALNDGHTIYYFGPNRDRFREAFKLIGRVWYAPEGESN